MPLPFRAVRVPVTTTASQKTVPPPDPPTFDPRAPVVHFPVRHHSPACAYHLKRQLEAHPPDAVLIEGPADATPLIPLLTADDARFPLAIYTTYAQPRASLYVSDDEPGEPDASEESDASDEPAPPREIPRPPLRHAAYYPLCDHSPELVAIQTAHRLGIEAAFIDLTYPQRVHAESAPSEQFGHHAAPDTPAPRVTSLQAQPQLESGAFIRRLCEKTGARDGNDLWDILFECNFRTQDTDTFVQALLTYCHALRAEHSGQEIDADGTRAREGAMAHAIAQRTQRGQRLLVVTGGFHAVALADTPPQAPEPVPAAAASADPDDNAVLLTRYGFRQLDALNGYAAGLPSPDFYRRLDEGQHAQEILVHLQRRLRKERPGDTAGVADTLAAAEQVARLAHLRGHATPTREDLLDAVRSCFARGGHAERAAVLASVHHELAGDRLGVVPAGAGQAPIVRDFSRAADGLRINAGTQRTGRLALDLYRSVRDRNRSRFFHQLRVLDVPFATHEAGPDFVAGDDLHRVRELWTFTWTPDADAALTEQSRYGPTLEIAAAGRLQEDITALQHGAATGRADPAVAAVLEACRCGLHAHAERWLTLTHDLIATDTDFTALVRALSRLLLLHVATEPLEAHRLPAVAPLAHRAFARAVEQSETLNHVAEDDESSLSAAAHALIDLQQAATTLNQLDDARDDRQLDRHRTLDHALTRLTRDAPPHLAGVAAGLRHAAGELTSAHLAAGLQRQQGDPAHAAAWLRGLMTADRTALLATDDADDGPEPHAPPLLEALHHLIHAADDTLFVTLLPDLRLALTDLTPRETDDVARRLGPLLGQPVRTDVPPDFTPDDLQRAAAVNQRVATALAHDHLTPDAWATP